MVLVFQLAISKVGYNVLYYENIEGGHKGSADNKKTAKMWAFAFTFLWGNLGK